MGCPWVSPTKPAIGAPTATASTAAIKNLLGFMTTSCSSSAQCFECGAELGAEKFGLLPGGEVSTSVDLVEIDQVAVRAPRPGLRRPIDVLGKDRDGHRQRDLGGLLRGRNN